MARKTSVTHWVLAGLFGLAVIGAGAAAVATLQARAAAPETSESRPPLSVSVATLQMQETYEIRESFVGRIEPARLTTPSFERAGKVIELLIEEGDEVVAGEILAKMDTRALEIERLRLEADRASLIADMEFAKRTVDRREQLVDDGWASRQAFDEAQFSLTAFAARRDAVTAAIARVDLDLEKSVIKSPFAGTVSARHVDEGTVVEAGTAVLSLQETSRPQARIGIPADRAERVSVGQTVRLTYQGRVVEGRIATITRDLQAGTRSIPVLVDLTTEQPLTMGQLIRLDLPHDIEAHGAWVPLAALREAERGLWSINTVVPKENGHVVGREAVEVLHVADQKAFVRGTFSQGVQFVLKGGHRLSIGQTVAPREGV